jgi:uncharacterized protein involved in exopolysaccharide biosynthesis
MKSEEPTREPITPRVLLRYKALILIVAGLVIAGGYIRIITQPRRYTAQARLKFRFSGDTYELQGMGNVKVPLLEEEVKACQAQFYDATFIDKALQRLPQDEQDEAAGEGASSPRPEELSPVESALTQVMEGYRSARRWLLDGLDTILMHKDSIVSERERRVAAILGDLEVAVGEEASHIIALRYSNREPQRAADIVNTLALGFIEEQKEKARKRDLVKLEADVVTAKNDIIAIQQKKIEIARHTNGLDPLEALKLRFEKIGQLETQLKVVKSARQTVSKKQIPFHKDLPIGVESESGDLGRYRFLEMLRQMEDEIKRPESAWISRELQERIRAEEEHKKMERIETLRDQLEVLASDLETEIAALKEDQSAYEYVPQFTALLVEEDAAKTQLGRAEDEFIVAKRYNQNLEDKNMAEHVTIWQQASVPPFPDPQRRLLKLIVVIVLGLVAGCAAALGRHLVWPKPDPGEPRYAVGGDLNVPIVVLPEQGDETLESDLEFDMTFPSREEERKKGERPG